MPRSINTFLFRLSWRQRWLLLEALFAVTLAALGLRLAKFADIARLLGWSGQENLHSANVSQEAAARDIGWAVRAVAARVPWDSKCLVQALAATLLSRWRRLPTTLYLGVAHGEQGALEAHAWLRCGSRIVTGAAGHERFKIVGRFARP